MSVNKAQEIANVLDRNLGFSLTSYTNSDIEFLKTKLEEFLELEVETEELEEPDDDRDMSEDDFNDDEDFNDDLDF
jgi:hypothetical protein